MNDPAFVVALKPAASGIARELLESVDELTRRVGSDDPAIASLAERIAALAADYAKAKDDEAHWVERSARQVTGLKAQLDGETARRIQEHAQHALELRRLRRAHSQAEERLSKVRTTVVFQVGQAIIDSGKSAQNLFALPGKLYRIRKELLARRSARAAAFDVEMSEEATDYVTRVMEQYNLGGIASTLQYLDGLKGVTKSQRASIYTETAKRLFQIDQADGIEIARLATQLDQRPYRMKWLAFKLWDAGHVSEANAWLKRARRDPSLTFKGSEVARAQEIESGYQILVTGYNLESPAPRWASPHRKRIAYVVSSAEPFNTSGYTSRTESVVTGLRKVGCHVDVFLRPGYPFDRADVQQKVDALEYEIKGITHHVSPVRVPRDKMLQEQIALATDALCESFKKFEPSVIHAASDYRNALPALVAARRLGIPFVYEVRGLWEFTTASKHDNWEQTERFEITRRFEAQCSANADAVMTLTPYMKDELVSRGAQAARIGLAPNCVDIERFRVLPLDRAGRAKLGIAPDAYVVGYAGSLVDYEGIDDLISAADLLRDTMPALRLLIIGDGQSRPMLANLVKRLKLQDRVIFTGRVQPDEVAGLIAMMDSYAVPRKPETVCHLVSPLKPLEAMAMGRPVIISNVGGMRGMVEDKVTGFVHVAGDAKSLAEKILECARDPQTIETMTRSAREFVERHRTWTGVGAEMLKVYEALEAPGVKIATPPATSVELA